MSAEIKAYALDTLADWLSGYTVQNGTECRVRVVAYDESVTVSVDYDARFRISVQVSEA